MRDLRRLLKYLLPHTGTFIIATFAMIVVAVLETATSALIVPIFDQAFAQTSAEDFVTALLHKKLATRWLLVGDDFRFGAKRAGDLDLLAQQSLRLGFELASLPSLKIGSRRVSSTLVREALAAGDFVHLEIEDAELFGEITYREPIKAGRG